MEFLLGIVLSWPALILLILIAIGFEHNEAHGWTVFALIIIAGMAFFMFNLTWTQIGIVAAAWIPVGLIWSFWRWKRHVSNTVRKVRNEELSIDRGKRDIMPSGNVDKITYWVLAWPFSLVEMLLGDIIDIVQSMIRSVFRGTYARISANGLAEIERMDK